MTKNIFLTVFALALCSCSHTGSPDAAPQPEAQTKTKVTITHATPGSIEQEVVLSATTAYLQKTTVASPIAAFVVQANVQPGMRVRAGQLLYRLESKEQHALGSMSQSASIAITASHGGIVLDVQQQSGCYVVEGATLCTVADAGSLVFEINVPYEHSRLARAGSRCTLELPDGTRLAAVTQQPMATMNVSSQSELVVTRAKSPFLPEGMNVKAIFAASGAVGKGSLLVPKEAVQSDETLTEFWVMTAQADGTAKKVSVSVVAQNAKEAEIKSEALSPQDNIIADGSYGLTNGASIEIKKQ